MMVKAEIQGENSENSLHLSEPILFGFVNLFCLAKFFKRRNCLVLSENEAILEKFALSHLDFHS